MPDDPVEPATPDDAVADPFESMEAEIASDLEAGGDDEADDPEDSRWRVQTNTGLLLFFPQAELACQWADGQDDADLQIAYGRSPLKPYGAFQEALKTNADPIQALNGLTPGGDATAGEPMGVEAIVQEASAPAPTAPQEGATAPAPAPAAPADGAAAPAPAAAEGAAGRPATMTSEFQFRTESSGSPWKARLIFMLIGLLAGAGGVYYAAWLGELPGILY